MNTITTSWQSHSGMYPGLDHIQIKQKSFEAKSLDSRVRSDSTQHIYKFKSSITRPNVTSLIQRTDPPRSQSDLGLYSRCAVCDDSADGYHFSAISCAACTAFFRRSIADQKTYACTTRSCNVSIKVQGKRVKPNNLDSVSISSTQIYTETSSRQNSDPALKKALKTRQPVVVLLSEIINMRRLVSARRYTDQYFNPNWSTAIAREYKLFETFMNSITAFGSMLENGRDWTTSFRLQSQFVIWFLFESVQTTIHFGGLQTNKLYFADLTSVDADETSLAAVFAELRVRDPVSMAKIVFPSVQFFMGNVCRDILNMRLDERETAALLVLLLLTQDKPKNREAIYDQVFRELNSTRGNDDVDCLRVANIVLFISTFIETVNATKEFIICWNVFCADK